ncbi:hypothetical protein TraAM80_04324 [Trypanosoma rangeli]|uniref:Uncharacterized protein n=1 Tax=Trypanosoma rangeli TaxID=5698 RepID=A0A3R7KG37_TRYRA|nr:uncharacterized protein TraAM80_04324 [Trypanosoma rangeli]RNF05791.1 hypothetical protein TraAM80_04324 [Trypanosoma rangeli]|eukprot:RNF05791.1 hypothetical protein TraAM80_04324 [Trypanosoma rangeli]
MLCVLEFALWVVAYVKPLVMGVYLCRCLREGQPVDATLITNLTLAMMLLWLLEVLDSLVLAHLLSMRALYICGRIILSLYLLHPQFRGATRVYNRFLAVSVARYAPLVDDLMAQHLVELERSGIFCYVGTAGRSVILAARVLLDFVQQLVFSSAPASLLPQPEQCPKAVVFPEASPQFIDIFSH